MFDKDLQTRDARIIGSETYLYLTLSGTSYLYKKRKTAQRALPETPALSAREYSLRIRVFTRVNLVHA
jgi:hypothetical protein